MQSVPCSLITHRHLRDRENLQPCLQCHPLAGVDLTDSPGAIMSSAVGGKLLPMLVADHGLTNSQNLNFSRANHDHTTAMTTA